MTLQQAFDLALARQRAGELAEAEALFRQLIAFQPDNPAFAYALFTLLYQSQRMDEALATLNRMLDVRPDDPLLLCMRGDVYGRLRKVEEARSDFTRSLALRPDNPETWFRLGNALDYNGERAGAISSYRRALALRPDYAEAWSNLATVLTQAGDLDQAVSACREGLSRRPEYTILYRNLAWACREAGYLDDAIAASRRAIALHPDHHAHGDLLFALHFHPDTTASAIASEHRRWYETHAATISEVCERHHQNESSPDRRLRVGYFAHDLGDNPLARFLLPLIAHHDRGAVESFCYVNQRSGKPLESQLMSCAHHWRVVSGMSDGSLADLIRQDAIDILVDLNLHTAGNRLLAFAQKPAPIQVTYLAYASTTGLPSVDYRFTDPWLDPPGSDLSVYVERSVHLRSYWCYAPLPQTPPVAPLPALSNGFITFGCLNDYAKVTPVVRTLWARLLKSLPASRLVLHIKHGSHRAHAVEHFAAEGIDPSRIQLVGRQPVEQYFSLYNRIDIALDPFPWAGGTTTCDALYMGVPVVTLPGEKAVSRGGLSILSTIGLTRLAADTSDHYLRIARDLAADLPSLASLRQGLRLQMESSPLMNASDFARDVESAYRTMWHTWCLDHAASKTD